MKRYRLAAMLTTAAMTVSFYGITVSAADDAIEKSWDGSYDTSWYDEQDTELHIFTAEELAGLAYLVNEGKKTFEGQTIYLEADIDMSGSDWVSIGDVYYSINKPCFRGQFNGNNHVIQNLSSNTGGNQLGLFGYCDNAIISNVNLVDFSLKHHSDIYASTARSSGAICGYFKGGIIEHSFVNGTLGRGLASGGIVGTLSNGVIKNCIANVTIETNIDKSCAGGICGQSINGIIEECGASGEITLNGNGYEGEGVYGGGICGKATGVTITNCYSQCNLLALTIVDTKSGRLDFKRGKLGGIVGSLSSNSKIENVYNSGGLSTSGITGGIIAVNSKDNSVSNAYYLSSTAATGTGDGEDSTIAKSAANMKKESFANLLGDAFVYVEGSFPKLAWELENGPEKTGTSIAEAKLKVGESTQMTVTNYTGSITWVSQNPEILMINSDGVATGLKAGKATIFAIIESGKALSGTIEVLPADYITGDCNGDGEFDISDVVSLQKWLITEESSLRIWKAADLSNDGLLSSIDLSLMKNILLSKN